jgi:hypothetical protein
MLDDKTHLIVRFFMPNFHVGHTLKNRNIGATQSVTHSLKTVTLTRKKVLRFWLF